MITIRPLSIVNSINLFRNYEVFYWSTDPAHNIPHRAAVPTWGHGGKWQTAGNISFGFRCAWFKTLSRSDFRSFDIVQWRTDFVDAVAKCRSPYFLWLERAPLWLALTTALFNHSILTRICLNPERLLNWKGNRSFAMPLTHGSSVNYVKTSIGTKLSRD